MGFQWTYIVEALRHKFREAADDEGGAVAVLVAGMLVFIFAIGTVAVDAGAMMLRDRKLQNAADMAVLAASLEPERAQEIITQSLQDNGLSAQNIESVQVGRFDPRRPIGKRFIPGNPDNAVRLSLVDDVPLFFFPVIGGDSSARVGARAVATNVEEAGFSATTGLASLEGGMLNSLLSSLLGTSVELTLIDYQGLLQTDIDALEFLDALAIELGVQAGTYNDLLGLEADATQVVDAMISVLNAQENLDSNGTTVLAALETLALDIGIIDTPILQLSDLLDLGSSGLRQVGSADYIRNMTGGIVALDLLFQSLYAGKMGEILDLGLAVELPGVADISVRLAVGEPLRSNSKNKPEARIVVGPVGSRVHTAPVRIQIEIGLLQAVALPGLGNQLLNVPIYIEVAGGDAEITDISCGSSPATDSTLTVMGESGAADIYIGTLDHKTPMENFKKKVKVEDATLLWIPLLLRLQAAAQVKVDGSGAQSVTFNAEEMAVPTTKRIGSDLALESTFSTLLSTLSIDIDRGLLAITSPILHVLDSALIQPVLNLLAGVSSALDPALSALLRTLGVHVGYMDITGYGVRCGAPTLVE